MARRLDWEKEAKRLKLLRHGWEFGYDQLPAVGSDSDKTRYLIEKGYRQADPAKRKKLRRRKTRPPSTPRVNATHRVNAGVMREALETIQQEMYAVFRRENSRLESSDIWQKLSSQQRHYLRAKFGLRRPAPVTIDSDEQANSLLREMPLAQRRNLVTALPRHFQSALQEAVRLLKSDGRLLLGKSGSEKTKLRG